MSYNSVKIIWEKFILYKFEIKMFWVNNKSNIFPILLHSDYWNNVTIQNIYFEYGIYLYIDIDIY